MAYEKWLEKLLTDAMGNSAMELKTKSMFGGLGLYGNGIFFGIIWDDKLFIRMSDEMLERAKKKNSESFQPFAGIVSNKYWSIPEDELENPQSLRNWCLLSVRETIPDFVGAGRKNLIEHKKR